MKYQFCIRFEKIDANSAASKAVLDCNAIFSKNGYQDHTITVGDNSQKKSYYLQLFKELTRFFFSIKPRSIIGIQYPLLSINEVFKYFIKIVRLKKGKVFCIIHDVESLRKGGKDQELIAKEVMNLNFYDYIIAHNDKMIKWLRDAGVIKPMISLELFDYLVDDKNYYTSHELDAPIVYAGNLSKSVFVYHLSQLKDHKFNLYGPGFNPSAPTQDANINWRGEFSPSEVVKKLQGSFGLIWDGKNIDKCDELLGNYLKYNNPHKFSLYLTAGLPVIAPADSAIAAFIKKHNVGILVNDLHDLDASDLSIDEYNVMVKNVIAIKDKVISGSYFETAVLNVEDALRQIQ